MRKVARGGTGALACAVLMLSAPPAAADILVAVSKSSQRMSVLIDGTARYNWKVSTGAGAHTTPSGVFKPQWLARKWRSRQYANAPMPHSIFFHKGYAIHGTTEVSRLGKAASHGCVRLHPENAALLYSLVEKRMASTRLVVSDDVLEAPGQAPKPRPNLFMVKRNVTPGEELMRKSSAAAVAAVSTRPQELPQLKEEPQAHKQPPVKQEPPVKKELQAKLEPPAKPESLVKQEPQAKPEPQKKPEPQVKQELQVKPELPAKQEPQVKQEPQEKNTRRVQQTAPVKALPRVAVAAKPQPVRVVRASRPGFHW